MTFDAVNNNDVYKGKVKSRWGQTDNVLELRDYDNWGQTIEEMSGFSATIVKQTPQTIYVRVQQHMMGSMVKALDKAGYNDAPKPEPAPYDPNVIHNTNDLKREINRWMSW